MRRYLLLLILFVAPIGVVQGQVSEIEAPEGVATWVLGSGPSTVIVLHGGPAVTHRYLRPEWDSLADAVRLVYYDQRGCGASERTDSVTWEMLVSDLEILVRSASERGRVVLAGSSWGTSLALVYALQHPGDISALVLSGVPSVEVGFPRLATPAWPEGRSPLDPIAVLHWDSMHVDTLHVQPPRRESAEAKRIREAVVDWTSVPSVLDSAEVVAKPSNMHPTIAARVGMACLRTGSSINQSMSQTGPLPAELSDLQAPTLIVRGSEPVAGVGDGAVFVDSVMPNSKLVSVPDAGHDPWLENPDAFFAAVRQFLLEQGLLDDGV
jgi:proline iminopeptidase